MARVRADRRTLARHRARAERQPPPARRVGARRRAAAVHDRPRGAAGTARRPRSSRSASAATSWPASRRPRDCALFGNECVPDAPVGACMVSTEGTCRIWHEYGGHPDLRRLGMTHAVSGRRRHDHAEARRRRPRDARADRATCSLAAFAPTSPRGDRPVGDGRRRGDPRSATAGSSSRPTRTSSSRSFFPGGDIGRLAVCGTVNDLAMMGATEPLGADLRRRSSRTAFRARDLERILRVDARRLPRGRRADRHRRHQGDGQRRDRRHRHQHDRRRADARASIRDCGLRPGDRIIVTGTIGDHGIAIMATRHELALESDAACPTSRRSTA